LAQFAYTYYLAAATNIADWSQRPSPFYDWNTYVKNAKLIGNDFDPLIVHKRDAELKERIREIDVWIVLPPDSASGYEKLLKDDIPILNLQMSRRTHAASDMFLSLKKRLDMRSKNIYMVGNRPMEAISKDLEQYGFRIVAVDGIQPTFTYFPLYLIKVDLK
jgi:hypothetical protein